VIVVDAKEREDEGDFVCAAEMVTPELVSFMVRRGAGVLCVPLLQETADRLGLSPLVDSQRHTALHQTPLMISVDHRDAGSGVSAVNRAKTILAMSDPNSKAADFVRPGHLNPLLAKDGRRTCVAQDIRKPRRSLANRGDEAGRGPDRNPERTWRGDGRQR